MSQHAPTSALKRRLRQIAHHLKPIVTVADHGITDNLERETDRALKDHELIKVRIEVDDRDRRKSIGSDLGARCDAHTIQVVGKVWVYYRANPKADPKLSNLARVGA